MTFAFEKLDVYQRALSFSVGVIGIIDEVKTPRKHSLYLQAEEMNKMLSGLINSLT
jgi:hypothetical protein